MQAKAPRGTKDVLGKDYQNEHMLYTKASEIFELYGFKPIETPMFEQIDVFVHGIGQATDVVSKEMFSVLSPGAFEKVRASQKLKDNQKLALRPEGTAGVVRSVVEHNMVPPKAAPVKLWYSGPMFRAEREQLGRYRQFNQIGAEVIGVDNPLADAQMIAMLMKFFDEVGIKRKNVRLLLNSMGDDTCRPAYRETVKKFIFDHQDQLCSDCVKRAELNPLRAFDCKNETCAEVMSDAPKITEALCDECKAHYAETKKYLDMLGIEYVEDPHLVRGLDYYTRTVFEVQVIDGLGAQNAIGGGGRYDKLMEIMGGKPTPGLGFAVGVERILIALENQGNLPDVKPICDCYIAMVDKACKDYVFKIAEDLRNSYISCEYDMQNRSLKSQFKQADNLGAQFCIVVGPDELEDNEVTLRNMETREESRIPIDKVSELVYQNINEIK